MIGSGVAGSTMPTVDFLSRAHTTNQDRAAAVRHALDRARYAAWLEALAAAMTAFEQHRWARLGFSLRMMPRTDALNNARAAFARFESALAQDLAKPTQDAADLDAGDAAVTASARECLTLFGACLDAWDRGPWWRLGVMLRRVAGRLRLAKAEFHLPSEDARVVLDEAALWDCVAVENLAAAGWQDGAAAALTRFQAHCRDTLFAERLSDIAARTNSVALRARLDATPGVLAPLMARTWTPGAEPLVSVIMPTFNRAALLPDAVRSVRDQTWPHWELLVCDDGGTDDSAAVVAAIGDPRVRWISLRHEGAAAARNAGLARAHGEYVAYLDSDNLWHPAYLEVMCNVMADRPAAMAAYADYTDVTLGGEAGPRLRPWPPRAFSYERLARHNFIDLNTFFHRLALTETLGSFTADLPKLQDWDLLLRYLFRESPIFVDLPLALYVRNPAVAQISQQRRLNARTTASIRARRRACYDAAAARHDRREDRALAVLAFASDKDAAQKAYAVVRAWSAHGKSGQAVLLPGGEEEARPAATEALHDADFALALGDRACMIATEASPDLPVLWEQSPPSPDRCSPRHTTGGADRRVAPFDSGFPVDTESVSETLRQRASLRARAGFRSRDRVLAVLTNDSDSSSLTGPLSTTTNAGWKVLTPRDTIEAAAIADAVLYAGNDDHTARYAAIPPALVHFLAAGVPVLAAPKGIFAEFARDRAVLPVDLARAETVARALGCLRASDAVHGEAARRLYLRRFSPAALCDRLELAYHALLGGKTR